MVALTTATVVVDDTDLPIARRLTAMLQSELAAVREERQLFARLDSEGIVRAAARKSAFRDAAFDLARQIAARLQPLRNRSEPLEQELAQIRKVGGELQTEERLNEELLGRVRAVVDGYVAAIRPAEAGVYGRGGRVARALPEPVTTSRFSSRG